MDHNISTKQIKGIEKNDLKTSNSLHLDRNTTSPIWLMFNMHKDYSYNILDTILNLIQKTNRDLTFYKAIYNSVCFLRKQVTKTD